MPALLQEIAAMRQAAGAHRRAGRRIAVVPTMGALHEGHLTLIRTARKLADVVITTVFVNPSQFGQGEDFERYPRTLGRDMELAGTAGADVVFAPGADAMYPPPFRTWVDVTSLDGVLEGRSRPGHFRGVATVVLKLFHVTMPDVAVFGQKDAQQVVVLRTMVRDLDLGVEMHIVPTVREADGLAMSSRNAYLSAEERREAPVLYRSLQAAERMVREGERSALRVQETVRGLITGGSRGVIDYVSVADADTLAELDAIVPGGRVLVSLAVKLGHTRLIDNVLLDPA
jgi:pantoate--beta-alanine ligase